MAKKKTGILDHLPAVRRGLSVRTRMGPKWEWYCELVEEYRQLAAEGRPPSTEDVLALIKEETGETINKQTLRRHVGGELNE